AAIPSCASATGRMRAASPARAARPAGASGPVSGSVTRTGATSAAIRAVRLRTGSSSTPSRRWSAPRIRREAPAAGMRMTSAAIASSPPGRAAVRSIQYCRSGGAGQPRCRISSPHACPVGVPERAVDAPGLSALAENLDLHLARIGQVGRQEALRHRLPRPVRIAPARAEAHDPVADPDRLVGHDIGIACLDDEGREPALRPLGLFLQGRRLADPVGILVPAYESVDAGLAGEVVGRELPRPGAEELVEAQRHHRPHPEGPEAEILPCRPERVPERALLHEVAVDLVAEVAGVTDALYETIDHPYGDLFRLHELERLGGNVGPGHARQQVARLRPGDLEAGDAVGDVLDRHARIEVHLEPAQVLV